MKFDLNNKKCAYLCIFVLVVIALFLGFKALSIFRYIPIPVPHILPDPIYSGLA